MGNTSSVPERIYKAARANDVNELQGLCRDMRLNGALDLTTKRQWLNWTDGEGRTALQWACQQNFLQIVQLLLDEGADIHKIAPKRRNGGSPLAEAVAGKHEALVELLLRYGADPFAENKFGKTPLDQALELKAVNIIRSFESLALFAGYINMKVLQLKGFSHAAKDRWVVIAPRFTPPTSGSGGVGLLRVMMLVYRNAAEAEPRTKCWLDGANIYRSGHEAVLKLHPNHEQPRNAFTKYDNGWMLFFKPATTSYSAAAAGATGSLVNNSIAAGAAATYAAFMAVCYRPIDHLQAQQQQRAAGGGALPHHNSSSMPELRINAPSPWAGPLPQQQPAATGIRPAAVGFSIPSSPAYSGNNPMSQAQQQQQQQVQQQYYHAGLHMQPAAAPPTAAQRPTGQQQVSPEYAMAAAPGESDEEFARRLASMMGGVSLSSRLSATATNTTTSAASSRVSSTTLAQQQQQGLQGATGTGVPAAAGEYLSLGPLHAGQQHGRTGSNASSDADTPSAPPVYSTDAAVPSLDNPFRHNPFSSNNPFLSDAAAGATGGSAAAAGVSGGSGAPYLAPAVAAASAAVAAAGSTGASIGAASADGGSTAASDQDCCVICLSNPREVGFLHGATVHKCVCRECAGMIQPGTPCPMCRQSIERVIGVY